VYNNTVTSHTSIIEEVGSTKLKECLSMLRKTVSLAERVNLDLGSLVEIDYLTFSLRFLKMRLIVTFVATLMASKILLVWVVCLSLIGFVVVVVIILLALKIISLEV
jgi:hypothetical protein